MSDAMAIALFIAAIFAIVVAFAWVYRWSSRESPTPDDDQPVAIANGGEVEVEILASKLDSAGIKTMTRNPNAVPPYRSPMFGWELLVRYADVDDARRVLDLDEPSAPSVGGSDDD
jgi:hypothetical protein